MATKPKNGKHPVIEKTCTCCNQSVSGFRPGRFDIEVRSDLLADLGQTLIGLSGIGSVDLIDGKIVLFTDISSEAEYYERIQEIRHEVKGGLWDAQVEYVK